ncbi:hypothetical protein LEMLEM_LOCUS2973, partial [Lemmus lemmus]
MLSLMPCRRDDCCRGHYTETPHQEDTDWACVSLKAWEVTPGTANMRIALSCWLINTPKTKSSFLIWNLCLSFLGCLTLSPCHLCPYTSGSTASRTCR